MRRRALLLGLRAARVDEARGHRKGAVGGGRRRGAQPPLVEGCRDEAADLRVHAVLLRQAEGGAAKVARLGTHGREPCHQRHRVAGCLRAMPARERWQLRVVAHQQQATRAVCEAAEAVRLQHRARLV
eukprot:564210-Prymnesium_polylepis.4